ncbi:hypothetical protein CYMTET_35007 [Cymbomonas tetramitiformis]|uniref:Piezo non-specific cation channel cap domain-containing protein n=1 Tax=Cymbomonas tetramitiformis TaxID=36881 RepID=A0AAE0F9Y9_9CHLO|nr:hypothetical protein CYMTET_35007 [Cymbomonas tetramitiformis]|eukprot:gene26290-32230_t
MGETGNLALSINQRMAFGKCVTWWSLNDLRKQAEHRINHCINTTAVNVVAVSKKTLGGALGALLKGFNILSLYTGVVLVIGRFLRTFVSGLQSRIIFENMQMIDYPWDLCRDIYHARADKELEIEEYLYKSLVDLYRNPDRLYDKTLLKLA